MKILMAALIYLFLATATYAQTTRAICPVVLPNEIGEQAQLYQNSHALLNGIGGDADTNSDGFVTGSELGQFLFSSFTKYTKNYQTPQYGNIRDRNLDQGDFIFAVQSDFMRQTEMQLEEQVKEAKRKIKPVNNELREIVSFLLDGKGTRAGALLSKYSDKPKVK